MKIRLAYDKNGLEVELPSTCDVTVVEPRHVPGLADPRAALVQALRMPIESPPLRDLVRPTDRVGIVFSDLTRPAPNSLILSAVLAELGHVPRANITLFNALGTHRPNTDTELRGMLGDTLVDGYRIDQNNASDETTQVALGRTAQGHDIWIHRAFAECDVKVLTGFIEPHLFAGFSGGGKAVMPGMAGLRTILGNHDARMISHPRATWGETHGNPIWEEIREVALGTNPTFLVNVTLNKEKQVTGIFAGQMNAAHAAGCAFVRESAMVPVPHLFDLVLTSNSGYPLDLNLYQSIKGVSAAARIVAPGGAILIAASCWEGIPEHGHYAEILRAAESPRALLEMIQTPGFQKQDQWQAQIQAQIQLKADVYVHSDHLTEAQITGALLRPSPRIEETVVALLQKYGPRARLCALPEGPQTIPTLAA